MYVLQPFDRAFRGESLSVIIFAVFLATTVTATVDLGFQVMSTSGCVPGAVYQPATCTRCVCGVLNLMLCRQTCSEPVIPEGNRPTGPTVFPILLPSINNRQPIIRIPTNFTIQLIRPPTG